MNNTTDGGPDEDADLTGDGKKEGEESQGGGQDERQGDERPGSPLPVPIEAEGSSVDADTAEGDAAAPPSDAAPLEEPSGTRRWEWLASAAVAAALSVVVVLTLAYVVGPALVANRLPPPEAGSDPRVAAMESRIAAVESRAADIDSLSARIDGLESRLGSAAGRADSLDGAQSELTRRIETVERRAAALGSSVAAVRAARETQPAVDPTDFAALQQAQSENASATAALKRDLDRLTKEIGRLGDARGDGVLLLLAAWRLDAAVEGAAPFTDRLEALIAVAGDDAEIARAAAVLAPLASGGTPTLGALRESFGDVGRNLIRAEAVAEAGDGWVDQTLARVKRIVTVRREGGDVSGEDAAATVSRAEAALASGDLAGAVAEVASLGTLAEAEAGAWLVDARARLALSTGMAAIMARAVERLDGETG